ncbi:MAG: dodecin family protein [Myxococcota bacterium]
MSVAKVIEITAASATSFQDAIDQGIAKACTSLEGVTGAWIQDQKVVVNANKITEYRVNMKVSFIMK